MYFGDRDIIIAPLTESDRPWVKTVLTERWGSSAIVTRGRIHEADQLPGLIARQDGERIGLLTYNIDGHDVEVVSLDSLRESMGVGTALFEEVMVMARRRGCRRVWLITTNDNLAALRFYQRRGMMLRAVYAGAITESRRLKPEIPAMGQDGIPIRDEIELDYRISGE